MAAALTCSHKLIKRTCISSLKSAIKSNKTRSSFLHESGPSSSPRLSPSASTTTTTSSRSTLPPTRRFSSRCLSGMESVQSLMPFHSTVAAARMTSGLTINSRSCRALSQGT
ncbi:hypothetical protein AAC387_Pa06g0047 [Persea americana]